MTVVQRLPSPIAGLQTIELTAADEPTLQRFFEANRQYFLAVHGEPAGSNEAHEAIHDEPPAEWGFTKKWLVGYQDSGGALVAVADVVSDLLAPSVWHIGLFLVATARHGTGEAQALYSGHESWAKSNGAEWFRRGVVEGNARAERFWASRGFVQTRTRSGVEMGKLTNTLRVMVKPLAHGTVEHYLTIVDRDRPD